MSNTLDSFSNLDVEQAVIAMAMKNPALSLLADSGIFGNVYNKAIWLGIRAMASRFVGISTIDVISLSEWVKSNYNKDILEYASELFSLDIDLDEETFDKYLAILREYAYKRDVLKASDEIKKAASKSKDSSDCIVRVSEIFDRLMQHPYLSNSDNLVSINKAASDVINDASKKKVGVLTGFHKIDEITNGLLPGEVIVLAARPGMGKTSLAMNIAENVVNSNQGNVVVFSLEMTAQQIAARMLSGITGISVGKMRIGGLSSDEVDSLKSAQGNMVGMNLYIDDSGNLSTSEIHSRLKRISARYGKPVLVIIDYIGLIKGSGGKSRYEDITEISGQIKRIAKSIGVPIILLAQLSRDVEKRVDKRPKLSDLRDSGAIEQDADMVIFIYRDEYYHRGSPHVGEAEILVAKNRFGKIGMAILGFDSSRTRFFNLTDQGLVDEDCVTVEVSW